MEKNYRLELIKEILGSRTVSNQEELQAELQKRAVAVTQATLSRDLKALRVSRVTDQSGKSRYTLPDAASSQAQVPELPDHLSGVSSIEFSGQLGVIKTIPGFANAVAYYLDQSHLPEIMGTIAGDDTILLISRAGISVNQMAGVLAKTFPSLRDKIV